MTLERAMEILDTNHREHYESIEPVNEACEIGRKAIGKQIAKKVNRVEWESHYDVTFNANYYCPKCGEYLACGRFPIHYEYCFYCGQKLDWSK